MTPFEPLDAVPQHRRVFCNRTLNLRSIKAIGYDMDYTLIHYRVEEWERRAYLAVKKRLLEQEWPVEQLQFEPWRVSRGLIIDTETGNLIKTNRFGYVKQAMHGTAQLPFDVQRQQYLQTVVDLADKRWSFLNTLFSLSEGCMYAQLVDLLDAHRLPVVLGYHELYDHVRRTLSAAHVEGDLKNEIMSAPDTFVDLDPETPLTLLDQKHAGKKILLITNSDVNYTNFMMAYTFDRFLPMGTHWRDLFDVVIVSADKPAFFSDSHPLFEIASPEGLLKPAAQGLQADRVYWGGSAQHVEKVLNLSPDEILYVGDHMFSDVHVTKNFLRWRTALILRELEMDIKAVAEFGEKEVQLAALMDEKERLEDKLSQTRLQLQRKRAGYAGPVKTVEKSLDGEFQSVRNTLVELDRRIAPLARQMAQLNNPSWGLLLRAGNDKSYLAYQLERYADVYTSRVSNFLHTTPFAYLRSSRGSLPHEPILGGGKPLNPKGLGSQFPQD